VCRRITGNAADADDAAQNALIAVVRGLPRFDGRSAFSSWVYRIATNASLDELRRRGRRAVPLDEPLEDSRSAPEIEARITQRLTVDDALATLPEEFRVAVVLRDLLDFDYAEIADTLGIPPGTVRSRIARGRAALAKALDPSAGNQQTARERRIDGTSGRPHGTTERPR